MSSNPPGPPGPPLPPGPPGPQGPYPPQPPYPPQQLPPQAYPPGARPWGPPPKKSNGTLITVLVVVAVLVLGGGGFFLFTRMADDSEAAPKIDTSKDLDEAPMGCAVLTEAEVAPYIPGRMEFEPTGFGTTSQLSEQDQCNWGNTDTFSEDGVRGAFVIVTSYLYHARINNSGYDDASGVDVAKEEAQRQARTGGGAVEVPDADDAKLAEQSDRSAKVVVRYRNVVYVVDYHNQNEGADLTNGAIQMATMVIARLVQDDEG